MNNQDQIEMRYVCHPRGGGDPVSHFNSKKENFTLDSPVKGAIARVRGNDAVKVLSLITFVTLILFINKFVRAESPLREVRQQIRKEIIQEKKVEVKEEVKNLLERAKDIVKEKIKRQIKGILISISGSVLVVQKDQTTFTVNTTNKTELKRKFGASSSLSEFSPNDQILIIGKRKENSDGSLSSTEIEASYIRNMSIQRRFVVFTGTVTAKSDNTLTLKTIGRGTQTIYVSANTKYSEKNKTIAPADISIGSRIIIKGELWDRMNDKVDAQAILKLPTKPTSPSPSVTPTSAGQ